MEKFQFLEKSKVPKLPKNPGVYCFKKGRGFLYIGKASNIRERVKNHFQQPTYRDHLFINQVEKIGYLKTNSEIEALILEANLIKKYQPKYNVVWRDDKNYFYVGITKEDFPRVFWTHQTNLKTKKLKNLKTYYVGPFVDGKALKQTLKVLRKIFPYRSCRILPKHPCLWYHLNRCLAPCLLKGSVSQKDLPENFGKRIKKDSQRNAESLIKILIKGRIPVLRDLKREMKLASQNQDFERAAKIRDQIAGLEKVISQTKIFGELLLPQTHLWDYKGIMEELKNLLKTKKKITRIEAYDVSNIQGQAATGSMVTFINGLPNKNFYRKFKIKIAGKPNDIAMIKEILLRRLAHQEWPYPNLILIDGGKAQLNAAKNSLKKVARTLSHPIYLMALAKKKNKLFIEEEKEPIFLKSLPPKVSNLILQLRDEAHRFAISYHKKLRESNLYPKS